MEFKWKWSTSLLAVLTAMGSGMTTSEANAAPIFSSNHSIKSIGLSIVSDLAFVEFTANLSGYTCVNPSGGAGPRRMFFDPTTARGKLVMSMLTSAHLAGKRVFVTGTGPCLTEQVDPGAPATVTEMIDYLRIE
jgi:hypothetical protein